MQYDKVLAIILGGGKGTRLYPLTQERCKPAISFGGKYRLIDIPISNCLNAGINKVFILTQFLTASLHRHIFQTYHLDMLSKGFIEVLPAEQTLTSETWYHGNADAVRQSVKYIRNQHISDVLILSGDQICRMDYKKIIDLHDERDAGLTVIGNKIGPEEAHRMGIIKADDETGKVLELFEKPKSLDLVRAFADENGEYIASTGNYLFKRDVLLEVLEESMEEDFGKHIIPRTIMKDNVYAYPFKGYWEDIGTIKSFFEANLELASALPRLNLYTEDNPIYTRARFLPAAKVQKCQVENALISEGSMVENSDIQNAVIGIRTVIGSNCTIRKAILQGNDFYKTTIGDRDLEPKIGNNVTIERAIVDKNVTIGNDVVIQGSTDRIDEDHELYCVRDGIVVIPKGVTIPSGTQIQVKERETP